MKIAPLASCRETRTIVFSFDEAYAKYFAVVLHSLASHTARNRTYDLIVLHDGLAEETKGRLLAMLPEGFVLRFFDVAGFVSGLFGDLSGKLILSRWKPAIFYDLLVPLLMPDHERVLYCDTDIIFRSDPEELFHLPFSGSEVAAACDALPVEQVLYPEDEFLRKQEDLIRNGLGLSGPEEYVNSGVILFNIPAIDRERYLKEVREALALPVLPMADQDVFNRVFAGRIARIPLRFNLQVQAFRDLQEKGGQAFFEEWEEAAKAPVILHYTTARKPWSHPGGLMMEPFWEEAEETPFYEEILRSNIDAVRADGARVWKYRVARLLSRILPGALGKRFQKAAVFNGRLEALLRILSRAGVLLLMVLLSGCGAGKPEPAYPPGRVPAPEFSHESGVYRERELTVTLTAPEGCTLAWTVNGKVPGPADDTGTRTVRLVLTQGWMGYLIRNREKMMYPEDKGACLLADPSLPAGHVVTAAVVTPGGEMGEPVTRVYFPGLDMDRLFPGCLVVSLVTDPVNLLDPETGILTPGNIYEKWKDTEEAAAAIAEQRIWDYRSNITQHGKAWERPAVLEIYDGGERPAVRAGAGIRITGNASRGENQKSFNVYFRDSYGSPYLEYELFEGIETYRGLRLRSGGNNAEWLKFKDAFLLDLVRGRRFAQVESRPSVLFLNGEYWGVYLLSEKVSDRMLADHYGVDPDNVILFKEGEMEEGEDGDSVLYDELMACAGKDLSDPAEWEAFCRIMDVASMADYCAARIWFGDADWRPDKNDMLWRTRDGSFNGGRWMYVLYDVEYSSGMYGQEETAAHTDHIRMAEERYPLFAAAMKNAEFRTAFLDALREIGTVCCSPERTDRLLAQYLAVWEPLMADHYRRFGDTSFLWENGRWATSDFFRSRSRYLLPIAETYDRSGEK